MDRWFNLHNNQPVAYQSNITADANLVFNITPYWTIPNFSPNPVMS